MDGRKLERVHERIKDAGVNALSHGCGQLLIINLECCDKVKDAGIT